MNKKKLLIFDCDGVLVDSERISARILAQELRNLGLDLSNDQAIIMFKGGSLKDAFDYASKKLNRTLPDNLEAIYRKKCFEAFKTEMEPIYGIHEVLNQLTNRTKCVASNGPANKIRLNLDVCKIEHHFDDNIFSAYDIKRWKPAPDLFLYAAKSMGYQPEECIVIEDSDHGIVAAREAGMEVFGYNEDGKTIEEFRNLGATPFQFMKDLPTLLGV